MIRTKWGDQKPPLGSQLNPGHPLAQGLVAAWIYNQQGGSEHTDLVRKIRMVPAGPLAWKPFGAYYTATSSGTATGPAIANSPFTIAIRVFEPQIIGNSAMAGIGSVGASNKAIHLRLTSTTSFLFGMYNDDLSVTIPAIQTGTLTSFVATLDSQRDQRAYTQGILRGSRTASSMYTGDETYRAAGWQIADPSQECGFSDYLVWNRALSPGEIAWLYAEPYAFITEPEIPVFYSIGGGISIDCDVLSALFSLPDPAVEFDCVVDINELSATFSLPNPTVETIQSITIDCDTLTATFSLAAPSIDLDMAFGVDVLTAEFQMRNVTVVTDASGNTKVSGRVSIKMGMGL